MKHLIVSTILAGALTVPAVAQQRQQYPYSGPVIHLNYKHEVTTSTLPVPSTFDMAARGVDCWGETLAVAGNGSKIALYRCTDNPVLAQGTFTIKGIKSITALAFAAHPIAKTDKLPLMIATQEGGKAAVVRFAGKKASLVANITASGITPNRWIVDAKNGLLLAVDNNGVVAWKIPNLMPKSKNKKSVPSITLDVSNATYTQELPAEMKQTLSMVVKNDLLIALCPDGMLRTWNLNRRKMSSTIALEPLGAQAATQLSVCLSELLVATPSEIKLLRFQ